MAQRGFGEAAEERPPTLRIIAANIKRLRSPHYGRQMSQREVALKAGLGHNALARLEKYRDPEVSIENAYEPSLGTLDALAQVFGVETAELLRWDPTTAGYLGGHLGRLRLLPGGGSGVATGAR
jgi:transcriptional regulator with XRE-family HTH domain